jgi:hypothetical protein
MLPYDKVQPKFRLKCIYFLPGTCEFTVYITMLFFGSDFLLAKSQLLTPEMDSRAKTKYKIIMQYFFYCKNKKFCS